MPAKSEAQRSMIFAKRGKYKSKSNTPQKDKWIWDSGWENKGKLESDNCHEADETNGSVIGLKKTKHIPAEVVAEGEHGTFDWPYLKLGKDGILYDEHGDKVFGKGVPKFKSVEEAEKWLEDNDERGTVTGLKEGEGEEFIDDIKKKPKISLVTKTLYPTEMRSDSSNISTASVTESKGNRVMFTKLINEVGSPNGEWGVRWREFNRQNQLVTKEANFDTEKDRLKFCDKLEQKDNFSSFDAWSDPNHSF